MMELYNSAQTKALFEREAVLMGTEDKIPSYRVAAILGQDAVNHVHSMDRAKPGSFANGYGVGDFTLDALTFKGFRAAVSFYNVQQLRKEAQK